MSETKSGALARFVTSASYEDLPEDIARKTLAHIVDSFAAGIAGAVSDEAVILREVLPKRKLDERCAAAWGTMSPLWAPEAALLNGTASHAFELDDTGGCDHSGAVVVPAAAAAAEIADHPVSGRDFILAAALGYDIARRPLEACGAYEPHNKAGFHSTGTCGPFGAAAAASKILGLTEAQTQNALGIASAFSGGLWACVHDGAMNKRLHAGHASFGGLLSALLAKRDFTGASQVFEEVWGGFNKSFAPLSSVPEAYTRNLGKDWRIRRVSIKPHAACRSTHAAIDAADILRERYGFGPDEVKEVLITVNPFVYGMCGRKASAPMAKAQLSMPYAVAADLVLGDASLASFSRTARENPKVLSMMERVRFIVDEKVADDEEPSVEIALKDGRRVSAHVPVPLGDPRNPVGAGALKKKFVASASLVLPEGSALSLYERLMALGSVSDFKKEIAPFLGSPEADLRAFSER